MTKEYTKNSELDTPRWVREDRRRRTGQHYETPAISSQVGNNKFFEFVL